MSAASKLEAELALDVAALSEDVDGLASDTLARLHSTVLETWPVDSGHSLASWGAVPGIGSEIPEAAPGAAPKTVAQVVGVLDSGGGRVRAVTYGCGADYSGFVHEGTQGQAGVPSVDLALSKL